MAEELDDLLRDEFRAAYPPADSSTEVLAELRPSMRRARVRHQVLSRSTALAAMVAVAAGVSAIAMPETPVPDATVVAGPSQADGSTREESSAGPTSTTLPGATSPTTSSIPDPSSHVAAEPDTNDPPERDPEASGEDDPVAPAVPLGSPTAHTPSTPTGLAPAPGTEPAAPGPADTPVTTTTSPVVLTSQQTIQSGCGSVVVRTATQTITLLSTNGHAGMASDVKNAGPEEVEVGFEGPGGHCEIKAEVRDGALWTDVDNDS